METTSVQYNLNDAIHMVWYTLGPPSPTSY